MANSFRPYCLYQAYLLPQSPREWLPEGHLAFFLEEMVSLLDLRPIFERYEGELYTCLTFRHTPTPLAGL